jgi:large subunit ribosomal protein LP0
MGLTRERKQEYFERMESLLDSYSKIFIVSCDNVGSKQFQQIRIALRAEAVVLMGKNTMMRKVVTAYLAKNPGHPYEMLLPKIMGNIGFVFTNGDLGKVRELIEDNRVPAPARVGAIAPIDVVVPPGPTDCDPGQTNFFQTLQIATKIVKGRIEITSPVNLLKTGDKVGNSEAVLLQKLHINPFDYGLVITDVYDNGSIFDVKVLDLTDDDLLVKFGAALSFLSCVCLQTGHPVWASMPHLVANAFKSLVSLTVECDSFSFAKADPFKAYLADPSAFSSPLDGNETAKQVETAEAKQEEEEEEEVDMGGGMDMFGGDGGGGDDY